MDREANLWLGKRKKFILFMALVMVVVLFASFLDIFREYESEKEDGNDSMYNSYRFFFRLYYPDDWDVEDDPNKFMLDKEQHLVMELFPLKEKTVTASPDGNGTTPLPTPTEIPSPQASATIDPREGMERDETYTMSIYYKEYDDIRSDLEALAEEQDDDKEGSGVNIQDASAKPTEAPVDKAPASNKILAEYIFEKFKESKAESEYIFYAPKIFNGETIEFMVLPFEYVENEVSMQGELCVASRGMAYYEILVEATKESFAKNDKVKTSILHGMEFSVFDY